MKTKKDDKFTVNEKDVCERMLAKNGEFLPKVVVLSQLYQYQLSFPVQDNFLFAQDDDIQMGERTAENKTKEF